ncbi:MAG: phage tail terminator-like protein [Solirubrobacterales bacterium]
MTGSQLHSIIRDHYATTVAGPLALPTAYPNIQFDPPVGETWTRLAILDASGLRITLGPSPIYRKRGIVNVLIATPLHIGDARSLEVADAIETAFRDQQASGVQFYETNPGAPERSEVYWQMVVLCPFYADDVT